MLRIARTIDEAGYEVWCVGGAVRDFLLGAPDSDIERTTFDLATSATPDRIQALFRRTVPIGIEHGTVAVFGRDRKLHEVTTFRRDVRTDGRHAEVEFGASLDEDLARRDLTINAIAYHPFRREWRDPFGGERDLDAGVIRAVGDPMRRFREDYLRILRALRFAGRFDFAIEPATWAAARACAPSLAQLSAERVRDEWNKGIVSAKQVAALVDRWREVGALGVWMPEVPAGAPGWEDALRAVNRLPRDPVLVTARISPDPGATLRRLRSSNAELDRAEAIQRFRAEGPPVAGAPMEVRGWLSRVGTAADDLIDLWEADGLDDALRQQVSTIRASGAPLGVGDLALSGTDLMTLGVPEGPAVGRMLRHLLDRVLESPDLNERETLTALVHESLAEGDG